MRRRWTLVGMLAGIALLGAGVVGVAVAPARDDVGFGAAPPALTPIPQPPSDDAPGPGRSVSRQAGAQRADSGEEQRAREQGTTGEERPYVATHSARVSDLGGTATPARVEVERLGIRAPVDAIDYDPDGAMAVPDDVRRAGWFRHGAAPGAPSGSAVLTAHVDSRAQGRGAFYPLREAVEGDRITVTDAGGTTTVYEVTAMARYRKDALPLADLVRKAGSHRLVLITCGGRFDEATGSYEENIVVVGKVVD